MAKQKLTIKNVFVAVGGKEVVSGVSLVVKPGEVHVLMGSNGSGKSSLTLALAGHPAYVVRKGAAVMGGRNIFSLPPEDRVKKGLFLAFQHPVSVPGVPLTSFMRLANNALSGTKTPSLLFRKDFAGILGSLGMPKEFVDRDVNVGFSGGEQRRVEMATMLVIKPKIALLDEIDSGLDVDGLKTVARIVMRMRKEGTAFVLITHTTRLLKYILPTRIHVMDGGKIVKSGNKELLKIIEDKGFGAFAKTRRAKN